jgi:hypothetical protein
MMLQRAIKLPLWAAVAGTLVACHDDGPTSTTVQGPLAALRYVNAISDTGALDFRIVDIVADAPATFGAAFRTGGSPIGQAAQTSPPYQAVAAGLRHIKVFNTSVDPVVAQQVHLDTTFMFEADRKYSVFMHGFARTGQTPRATALIATDEPLPAVPAGKFAIRVLNLAPSLAGAFPALADTTIRPDALIRAGTATAPPSGAPDAVNLTYLGASLYAVLDTGRYRLSLTATGTTSPFFLSLVPAGIPGSNPSAGSQASGTVLTAVVTARSVVGSTAPQGGRPAARATDTSAAEATRRVARSNDTVTVQSGSINILTNRPDTVISADSIQKNRPDSVVGGTGTRATTGVVAGDIVLMSGATEPEYNVWQVVARVADSLSCAPVHANDTATKCAATNAIATTRFRFRSRIVGTPASPATGTPVYRIYTPTAADYTMPSVTYLIDKRP